jgi:hypothetical protein
VCTADRRSDPSESLRSQSTLNPMYPSCVLGGTGPVDQTQVDGRGLDAGMEARKGQLATAASNTAWRIMQAALPNMSRSAPMIGKERIFPGFYKSRGGILVMVACQKEDRLKLNDDTVLLSCIRTCPAPRGQRRGGKKQRK